MTTSFQTATDVEALRQQLVQAQLKQASDSITTFSTNDGVVITAEGRVWSNRVLLDGLDLDGLDGQPTTVWQTSNGVEVPQGVDVADRPIIAVSGWANRDDFFGSSDDDLLVGGENVDPSRDGRCDPKRTYGEGEGCDTIIDMDHINEDGSRPVLGGNVGHGQEDSFGGGPSFIRDIPSEAETLHQLIHQNTDQFI